MKVAALLAAALLAVTPLPAHAGACAQRGLVAHALTHPADAVPDGGGVLISVDDAGFGGGTGEDPLTGSWQFDPTDDDLGDNVAVTLQLLAPGLARVVLASSHRGHAGTILDASGAKITTATFDAPDDGAQPAPWKAKAPAVASVKTAKRMVRQGGSYRGKSPSYSTTVSLSKKPPADARALVVYRGDDAIAWAAVSSDTRKYVVYETPGRCSFYIPGLQSAEVGERVTVAFVDGFGRLSPRSKQLKVGRGR